MREAGFCVGAMVGLAACVDNLAICINSDSGVDATIIVEIRDAVTRAPLASGARGIIRDGTYTDSLRAQTRSGTTPGLTLGAGGGRPGRYDVTVIHPGYRIWEQSGVVVEANNCGVADTVLRANLVPTDFGAER